MTGSSAMLMFPCHSFKYDTTCTVTVHMINAQMMQDLVLEKDIQSYHLRQCELIAWDPIVVQQHNLIRLGLRDEHMRPASAQSDKVAQVPVKRVTTLIGSHFNKKRRHKIR